MVAGAIGMSTWTRAMTKPDQNKKKHLQGDKQGGTSWDVINDNGFSANITKLYFLSLPLSHFDFRSMEQWTTPNKNDLNTNNQTHKH